MDAPPGDLPARVDIDGIHQLPARRCRDKRIQVNANAVFPVEGHKDPRYLKACALFEKKLSQRAVKDALKPISLDTVNKWHQEWEAKNNKSEPEPAQQSFSDNTEF